MARNPFGVKLAEARVTAGMSQQQLGKALSASHSSIQAHEQYGRYMSDPEIETWLRACGRMDLLEDTKRLRDEQIPEVIELQDGRVPVELEAANVR